MEDTELAYYERILIQFFGVAFVTIIAGVIFAPETFWDGWLRPLIWDPIVKDASVSGDAGYSLGNTAIYIAVMIAAVVAFQALFRKWQLPCDDKMVWALIAWVVLAPVLRVLEDADFFSDGLDVFFISPLIHLHLAAWLILAGVIGHFGKGNILNLIEMLLFAYLLFTGLLLQPNWDQHEMGTTWVMAGGLLGALTIVIVIKYTASWHHISRSVLALASGLIVMGLGHWAQLVSTPWAQESGVLPKENDVIWPLLVVIGIPAVISVMVWRYGQDDLAKLRKTGHEPGIIPDGLTLKEWESEDRTQHPVEIHTKKAILATPLVAGMLFGQLCDGLATMVGIDWFGYSEKHPVSDSVIQFGDKLDLLGEGAWLFFIVKAVIVSLIVYLFAEMRIERNQRHLRVLIVLAVMIVGMAPGLRDIGRLILGV